MRVLVVEDHHKLAAQLRRALRGAGMATDVAVSGEDALWMAGATRYDVVVLDVMLPGIDGLETCRRLREDGMRAPVLMLTARDALRDRVAGLDGGADDYLTKPFALDELVARLRALSRRGAVEHAPVLAVGPLRLDPATRMVWRDAQQIELPVKTFALLQSFMRRPGVVLSRLELLDSAWDDAYENRSNVVDVQVRRLRARIDGPFRTDSIETIRGVGYRLRPNGGQI
jgi:two-component system, OmpR family, response regulator